MKRFLLCVALNIAGCLQMFAAADFNLSGIEIHDFYEGKTQTLMEKNMRGELNRINDHLKYNRYKDDVNPELWKRLAEIRDDWQTNRVDDAELLKVAECIGDMAVFLDYKEMERESLAIFHSARMQEINEAEKIARCEERANSRLARNQNSDIT